MAEDKKQEVNPPKELKPEAEVKQEPVKQEPQPQQQEQPKGKLPEKVADRTREQFDKLVDSNKRLLEANKILQGEVQRKVRSEQQFAPIQQPQPTQVQTQQSQVQQQVPEISQFIEVDPNTGERYINEQKLNKSLLETKKRAENAESAVQNYIKSQEVLEEQKQTKEAFVAHPELNPQSEKYNKKLSKRTRQILLDSMMNPADYSGYALTFREAADLANKQSGKEAEDLEKKVKVQEKGLKEKQEKEAKRQEAAGEKEQASLVARGQRGPQPLVPAEEMTEADRLVVKKTREGDVWALARRLQNTPHVGTPSSSEEESKESR